MMAQSSTERSHLGVLAVLGYCPIHISISIMMARLRLGKTKLLAGGVQYLFEGGQERFNHILIAIHSFDTYSSQTLYLVNTDSQSNGGHCWLTLL